MAAVNAVLQALPGGHVIIPSDSYHGVRNRLRFLPFLGNTHGFCVTDGMVVLSWGIANLVELSGEFAIFHPFSAIPYYISCTPLFRIVTESHVGM